jgi:hypothetical protein
MIGTEHSDTSSLTGSWSAPDWLTATWKGGEEARAAWTQGMCLVEAESEAGDEPRPLTMMGYRGWQTTHAACGVRGEEVIVRCGGRAAASHAVRFLRSGGRPSRLDVQTTEKCVSPVPTRCGELWAAVTTARPKGGRRPACAVTQMKPAGWLLTVGRRSSETYGRVYDKGVEAKLDAPFKLWRFEVETKKHTARALGALLASAPDLEATCAYYVTSSFSSWGVYSRPSGPAQSLKRALRQALESRDVGSDRRKLEYLRTVIRPMLRRLRERVSDEELREALQWPPPPPPNPQPSEEGPA